MKISEIWQKINHFFHKNFIVLFLIIGGVWFFTGNDDHNIPRPLYKTNYESVSMDMAPRSLMKSSSKSIGGGIIAYANDSFVPQTEERKIIKNGNISIKAKNTDSTKFEVEALIKKQGGEVINLSSWQVRPSVLGYNLTTKIPSEKLEKTLIEISKMGEKMAEGINVRDITRDYQDTENKLKNLELRRERLREMMKTKTDKLADVLAIDKELNSVQIEIERLERTQIKRDVDVQFSTLQISIQPKSQIGDVENPTWNAEKSWSSAVNNLIEKSRKIFDSSLKILLLAPIWLPILLIIWFVRRKFFLKK